MNDARFLVPLAALLAAAAPVHAAGAPAGARPPADSSARVVRSDAEWRRLLTPLRYEVLRREGTERAFSGALWNEHRRGRYRCAGCGFDLFESAHKFDSGTGWPSFWKPAGEGRVHERSDDRFGMRRVEVECARCGGHLGHVFDDGPRPTGLRYCINSAALEFTPAR